MRKTCGNCAAYLPQFPRKGGNFWLRNRPFGPALRHCGIFETGTAMAFLIYFFVLLVSAASVLFGLDLMSSPLPKTPNVPIGRSVQVASQPLVQEVHKKAADEQALTPVYPTTRGAPKVQAEGSREAPRGCTPEEVPARE